MVGPDFQRPAPPSVKAYTKTPLPGLSISPEAADGSSQQLLEGRDIPAQWWTLFHSPALNHLVEQALKSNPSLEAAQATLRQAQENVYAARGALYPSCQCQHFSHSAKVRWRAVWPTVLPGFDI